MAIVKYATIGTINYTETAAITDLTGTKWVFNGNIPWQEWDTTWSLIFTSNGTTYYNFQLWTDDDEEMGASFCIFYYPRENQPMRREYAYTIDYDESEGSWVNDAYRTIEITGGNSATNATLINFLQTYATQQVEPEPEPTGGMYFGTLGISNVYFGTSEVSKIYLGDALVYEGVSIPDNALLTADNTYLVDSTGGYLLTTEI